MADEEEEQGQPLLTFPDGSDSFAAGLVFEGLHTLKLIHKLIIMGFTTAVFSSALAWGVVDKIPAPAPGSEPFSHYHWFTLAGPVLGIFLTGVMWNAWVENMVRIWRMALTAAGFIWIILLLGLGVFIVYERFVLCKDGPPFDRVWCTDGGPTPIDWQYDWYALSALAQLLLTAAELFVFNMISVRVRTLMHPMNGLTHEQVVRELYSTHGPRYITSIGASVADMVNIKTK